VKPLWQAIIIALLIVLQVGIVEDSSAQRPPGDCLVPCDEIVSGGPPKDVIPALTNPDKFDVDGADWLSDDAMVLGVYRNGQACAYPLAIFYWHEIVNDQLGDVRSSITYCPLTGTGMHFDAKFDGNPSDFGVSGSLWSSNLIMYNRSEAESWWSQMKGQAIVGPGRGHRLTQLPVVETTWRIWRTIYPQTKVLSNRTGYARDYTRYPYGNYEQPDAPPFFRYINPKYFDSSQPPKLRVLGLVGEEKSKVYPFTEIPDRGVINDTFDETPLLIVSHLQSRMALAFDRRVDGEALVFDVDGDDIYPFALKDRNTNSRWNVFGHAVSGPLAGKQLSQRSDGIIAFWFAWAAFHPSPEIYVAGTETFDDPMPPEEETNEVPVKVNQWELFESPRDEREIQP